jgi:hypothetical protein
MQKGKEESTAKFTVNGTSKTVITDTFGGREKKGKSFHFSTFFLSQPTHHSLSQFFSLCVLMEPL